MNTDTIEFAVKNPDPAAAGTPIPGYVESPVAHRFVTPVAGPGGNSAPYTLNRVMSTPGPYVPSVFFTNRFCVSGVATNSHSTRFRMSGITFSNARYKSSPAAFFIASYSSEP